MTPVNVGVVGLGFFGQHHLKVLASLSTARVAGVCDISPERLEAVGDRFAVDRRYRDAGELVGHPDVEAIHVVTPEDRHLEAVLLALEAGKPVLCEKPLAIDLDDVWTMIEAEKASTAFLMPGHILRFDHRYQAAKRMLEHEKLGSVAFASFRRWGNREIFPDVWSSAPGPMVASIHDIDLALWYLDSVPVSVVGAATSFLHEEIPDTYIFTVRFETGAVATFETSCLPPPGSPFLSATTVLLGTEGMTEIRHPSDALHAANVQGALHQDLFAWPEDTLGTGGALHREIAYFIDCVREARPPTVVTAEDGRRSIQVARAAIEATLSGEVVEIA